MLVTLHPRDVINHVSTKTMQIKINGKKYKANEGEMVLDVCRREGIKIPALCSYGKLKREAACRLCLVEIADTRGVETQNLASLRARGGKLVTSCTTKVCDGLEVITESERIKKAREINLELLWADHAGKCATCKKNRQCEFQKLAEDYKIENFHFVPRKDEMMKNEELDLVKDNWSRVSVEDKNPVIERNNEFCVECRRCINVCPVGSFGHNFRGGASVIGTAYNEELDCIFCGACVAACPTAALTDKGDLESLIKDLDDINILSVAVVDPAVADIFVSEFGVENKEKLNGLLREAGFERVFDLTWGFEKYVQKISEEVHPRKFMFKKKRSGRLVISSFCPSAELYIKKYHPEFSVHIAKTARPEELMARAVKDEYAKREKIDPANIRTVLISSCVARKKLKSHVIDHVITGRELERLVRMKNIKTEKLKESLADKFLDGYDEKYAKIMQPGGLAEALGFDVETRFIASAYGVPGIKKVLRAVTHRQISPEFLETMVCPEGCGN